MHTGSDGHVTIPHNRADMFILITVHDVHLISVLECISRFNREVARVVTEHPHQYKMLQPAAEAMTRLTQLLRSDTLSITEITRRMAAV